MSYDEIITLLKSKYNEKNVAGMSRSGIKSGDALGIPVPEIRKLAKEIGKDHEAALKLWESGIHEAKLLSTMIDDPRLVTKEQFKKMAADFDSWDIVDQACSNLIRKTKFCYELIPEWAYKREEFIKRAGFTLIAVLAVHDKKLGNDDFEQYLELIKDKSTDERNFVKKAVNWALRQIGKRNSVLNKKAILVSEQILMIDNKASKWIAGSALKELRDYTKKEYVKKRWGLS